MADRAVYHVTPNVNGWQVKGEGEDAKEFLVDDKENAIQHAKELAKSHHLSQVIVHNRDGQISDEFTYGEDPSSSPG